MRITKLQQPLPIVPTTLTQQQAIEKVEHLFQLHKYSKQTRRTYTVVLKKFFLFIRKKDINTLTMADADKFLKYLISEKKSPETQYQAFNVLRLFYTSVFVSFPFKSRVKLDKREKHTIDVLSHKGVVTLFDELSPPYDLIAKLMYGCGLRISECIKLRLTCVSMWSRYITIFKSDGSISREVRFPKQLENEIKAQFKKVNRLFNADRAQGSSGCFIDEGLKIYPTSSTALRWQYLFPAKELTVVNNETGEMYRSHLHATHVQKAIMEAAKKNTVTKNVTAKTLRHSCCSHLLQAGCDLKSVQEMMGHSDKRTTIAYYKTFTPKDIPLKNPLDILAEIFPKNKKR